MKEGEVTRDLVKHLRKSMPGSVIFKHADMITAGIPDISVTGYGRTIWLEIKISKNGKFKSTNLQDESMRKLAMAGRAFYVLYDSATGTTTFGTQSDLITGSVQRVSEVNHDFVKRCVQFELQNPCSRR
jgi:hypothetical protein